MGPRFSVEKNAYVTCMLDNNSKGYYSYPTPGLKRQRIEPETPGPTGGARPLHLSLLLMNLIAIVKNIRYYPYSIVEKAKYLYSKKIYWRKGFRRLDNKNP